jgi:radical SAM protein with 4Fe4S-binding SPASM domain
MLKKIILGIIIGAVVFTTSAGFLYAYQKESGVKHNLDYKNSVISKNANNSSNNNQNYKNRLNNQDCQNCVNSNDCNTDCYQYRFSQTNPLYSKITKQAIKPIK